jgi:hypothetical protein
LRLVIHAARKSAHSEEMAPLERRAINIPRVNVIATYACE